MLKSGLLKANQIRAMQPLCASFASKSIVRLVRVFFYYYSFLSKGGIKSSKDEDKLESFDVEDGGRLYLNDVGRVLYCYRTIIHEHVLQNCNA